jgi:hypothetical protein
MSHTMMHDILVKILVHDSRGLTTDNFCQFARDCNHFHFHVSRNSLGVKPLNLIAIVSHFCHPFIDCLHSCSSEIPVMSARALGLLPACIRFSNFFELFPLVSSRDETVAGRSCFRI